MLIKADFFSLFIMYLSQKQKLSLCICLAFQIFWCSLRYLTGKPGTGQTDNDTFNDTLIVIKAFTSDNEYTVSIKTVRI